MLLWRHQDKIFQTIIQSIAIFVVHMHPLWGVCKQAMLVAPLIGVCGFHLNVVQTGPRFVRALASDRRNYANFGKHAQFGGLDFGGKCFIRTISAARSIVICIAIGALPTYNRATTKRAGFGYKFFHPRNVCQE